MSRRTTRRDFVKTSAALGTAFWVAGRPGMAQDSKSANEKLQFACVGVGGKGSSDTDDAGRNGDVIALCDIDENRLEKKAARFPDAKKYVDYREMFDELGDKIDATTVSTPDHSHTAAASLAMTHGSHVFVQKPLTWSVNECRHLRKLAQEKGVATQMGNQGTAGTALREAVEVLQSGGIGDVAEIHVWTNRPVWPQGLGRPENTEEVPKGLHWDLFIGPAPYREYHSAYAPFKWRGWIDFGTGALGDMACHTMNMPVMGLALYDPVSLVSDHTGIVEGETYPKSSHIVYEFPERKNPHGGTFPACTLTWYDGGRRPVEQLQKFGLDPQEYRSGALVIGEKATVFSGDDYCGRWKFVGGEGQKPEPFLPRTGNHFREFAEMAKDPTNPEKQAMSSFPYATRLTETVLLGNFAIRSGSGVKLQWDAEAAKVTNRAEANEFLGRDYREGWELYG